VHAQFLLDMLHPAHESYAANKSFELASEDIALQRDRAITSSYIDSMRMTHKAAQASPDPVD
jgi:hypothetical protein